MPGIEIEVKPGIHVLVIFNNSTRTEVIEKFLFHAGYGSDSFGVEEPPRLSSWDFINLCQESEKYDCIIIDAHTDSNKGIWKETRGSFRANCLRTPQLCAVGYKSEEQKNRIQEVLGTALEYKRSLPLTERRY